MHLTRQCPQWMVVLSLVDSSGKALSTHFAWSEGVSADAVTSGVQPESIDETLSARHSATVRVSQICGCVGIPLAPFL